MNGISDGILGALYFALLAVASDLLPNDDTTLASRIRNMLALGIALPGLLAVLHLLYAPLLWGALAIAAAFGWRGRRSVRCDDPWLWLAFSALALVIWEPLCRPLLEGDSLEYHLPNAASWVNAHSLWTTNANYWPYPPASELFAAGIFACAGRFVLPLAGVLPALMLLARIIHFARDRGAPGYAAAAVALAFLTMPLAAFQIGTLQNDLWLAAFFVEALAIPSGGFAFAVCALLKPIGWILALIGALVTRRKIGTYAWIAAPLAFWALRDAILYRHSLVNDTAPGWETTIAAHLATAAPLFVHVLVTTAPQLALWLAALVAGLFTRERTYAIAGLLVVALFAVLPVTYASGSETYLAWGTSLRYLLPAAACGALVVAGMARRAPVVIAILAFAVAIAGAADVVAVFANDAIAGFAPYVACIAIVAALLPWRRPLALAFVAILALVIGAHDAASRAGGFYADWMRAADGRSTGVFAWIARNEPARLVTVNVRAGAVTMVSPRTWTLPVAGARFACERARSERALLFAGSNEIGDAATIRRELTGCGKTLYADGAGEVLDPRIQPLQ